MSFASEQKQVVEPNGFDEKDFESYTMGQRVDPLGNLLKGLQKAGSFLRSKLTDPFAFGLVATVLYQFWTEHRRLQRRAYYLDMAYTGCMVALAPLGWCLGMLAALLVAVGSTGTYWWLRHCITTSHRDARRGAVKQLASTLGVCLGAEGLKSALKVVFKDRAEESTVEDLADAMSSDSLVGLYFFVGAFYADNIKALLSSTLDFARVSRVLLGPLNWLREKLNDLITFDWVNPWWLASPMEAVRRNFSGHWINFNVLGFKPFLFLRRNARRISASVMVGLGAYVAYRKLPFRKRKPADSPKPRVSTRGMALFRKRIASLRPQEAKGLNKGKGKNKGRAKATRADGTRRQAAVRQKRAGKTVVRSNTYNRTVGSDLHWYDDDQVVVYDPRTAVELEMVLGSREFEELYASIRKDGLAEQAYILNQRTDEVVNFYGDYDGQVDDDYEEVDYEQQDFDEVYRDEECGRKVAHYREGLSLGKDGELDAYVDFYEEEAHHDCGESRTQESSLGRDSLSLSRFKGGTARNGDDSISVPLISGRLILMKHFVDKVKGKTFEVTISGHKFLVDKDEGYPLGDGGELISYAQPKGLTGVRSTRARMAVPTQSLNGCEVVLIRFGDDGPSDVSAGRWHDGNYSAATQPGWCGSLVMVFPNKGAAQMVGMHRWGESDGLNGCEAFDIKTLDYFKRTPPHPVK